MTIESPPSEWLEDVLSTSLGDAVRIQKRSTLRGGCISHAERLHTGHGDFFFKWSPDTPQDLYVQEAAGLRALGASRTPLTVPTVIACSAPRGKRPGYLILEYLPPEPVPRNFETQLGAGLATLHRQSGPAFGFEHSNHCGETSQPNAWTENWIDFYRTNRLGHQIELARNAKLLDLCHVRHFERLLARLDDLLAGPQEPPALIHGDLWSGNVYATTRGRIALIDPAAYYGHREAELGMMTLFGGFGERTYTSYNENYPLAKGWRQRNPLYQLYHLLNHANLFGGGYVAQSLAVVRRYI